MMQVLQGIKVVDLSTVLAGPSVGSFLAELGAEVTKYESPRGDVTRNWRQPEENKADVSAYFASVNTAKKYTRIDLLKQEELDDLFQHIDQADILLMNFKRADYQKFGLSDELLRQRNRGLIIGKISGFGEDSDRVAFDLILQAETGWMSMNGQASSPPTKMPVALIDVLAAHQLKEGILLAFYAREKTGLGRSVSVSLYDAAISSLTNQASNYLKTGVSPKRAGSLHPNIAPYGEIFTTKDNQQITFAIGSDEQFKKLCSLLGQNQLGEDQRFCNNPLRVENRRVLSVELQNAVQQLTYDFIDQQCNELFIPFGKIKDLEEVFSSSKAQDLMVQENIEGFPTKKLTSIAFQWK